MSEELLKKFTTWIKLKVRLNMKEEDTLPTFREGEVWWASIGMNIGYEQYGKHANFERPILILRKFNKHMFLAIPMTSKDKDTPYHIKFDYRKYAKERDSDGNLLYVEHRGIIVMSQLKNMSTKRLLRKVGVVNKADLGQIRDRVRVLI